jgi:hypothetical protein
MQLLKPGFYRVISWSGVDLGLMSDQDELVILSKHELPKGFDAFDVGEKFEISVTNEVLMSLEHRQRHARILSEIAGIENTFGTGVPDHLKNRLANLRIELAKYEPADPTAVTLEMKRANASVDNS